MKDPWICMMTPVNPKHCIHDCLFKEGLGPLPIAWGQLRISYEGSLDLHDDTSEPKTLYT